MMKEFQDKKVGIFTAALALGEPEERARYLDEACGDDAELRQRVEALLHAHDQAGDFLEQIVPGPPPNSEPAEQVGTMIGRYKLLEEIGEGGFGVVYMANQVEPVQRKVALKIVKAGMDTRAVVARFEAERQALALMDHPNIAHVLDAGATETGRPYFVMELVRGVPITEFCDQKRLTPDERLELFMTVCHAVQHAHQKGIIHRDLKPTNVLVTLHDGIPVPKVIDFGVAKALGKKLTEKTLFTGFAQMVGTPAYMSPEQAELSGLDVDTRSDIYSLGVLLYELLTGVIPLDRESLSKAALEEVCRMIRETKPQKPSTRLRTLGDKITDVAGHRHVEAPKLEHILKGDLDWIVMKCLEKDRRRRYETANGVAMDVQRHLNDKPVLARHPSRIYELQKAVRRHRFGFAAAAVLVMVLALGVLVSTGQALRALRAEGEQIRLRREAETEAAKAKAINDFLLGLLGSADPQGVRQTPKDYTVRQLLDDYSADIAHELADQPQIEAAVRITIGKVYKEMGMTERALPHLERGLALLRQTHGPDSKEVVEALVACAWAWLLKSYQIQESEWGKAAPYAREAEEISRRHGDSLRMKLVEALALQQWALAGLGRWLEAESLGEEIQAIASEPPSLVSTEVAIATRTFADVRIAQGRFLEAEALACQALAMDRELLPTEHPLIAWDLYTLGRALLAQQKLTEAKPTYEEALRVFRQHYMHDSRGVQRCLRGLRDVLTRQQDWTALEALLRDTLEHQRALAPNQDRKNGAVDLDIALTLLSLADAVGAQNRADESERYRMEARLLIRETVALIREKGEHADAVTLNNLAWLLVTAPDPRHGDGKLAVELAERAVEETGRTNAMYLDTLAAAFAEMGDFPEAVHAQKEAIALLENPRRRKDYESRLKLFEAGEPYRQE